MVAITSGYLKAIDKRDAPGRRAFYEVVHSFVSEGWVEPISQFDHQITAIPNGGSLHVAGMGFAALNHDPAVDGCGLDLRSTAYTKDAVTIVPGALSIVTDVAFADDGHIF